MSRMRWQDWVTLAAGIWLLFSPAILNYAGAGPATSDAVVLGIVVIILSIIELSVPRVAEEWAMVALGVWLVLSPWLLGFGPETTAAWNSVVVGMVIGVLALWAAMGQRSRGGGAIAHS
jgi:hypothetical protein